MTASAPPLQRITTTAAAAAILSRLRNADYLDYHFYGELIQHCADHRLLLPAKQLHARLVLSSVTPGNYLASKLISLYSKHGLLHESQMVFDSTPDKTVFSFNAMLIAYSLHHPSLALRFFSSLPDTLKPDAVSISVLLKILSSSSSVDGSKDRILRSGCFGSARKAFDLMPERNVGCCGFDDKDWILGNGLVEIGSEKDSTSWNLMDCGWSIHGHVVSHGFEGDLFVANGLVTMYSRFRDVGSARKVFDSMVERDVVSWNSLVSGYSQSGFYEECLGLYRRMEMNCDELKPNNVTVVSALHACAQLKDLDFGMKIHRSLADNKIVMDAEVWNSVVGLYEKCGRLEYARELFDEAPVKDEVSYGVMISGYMSHGFVDQAMEVFRKMEKPALSIWNAMISGLAQNNCHKDVPELLNEMQCAGIRPNSITLSSILPTISFFSNLLVGKQVHCYAIRNDYDRDIYVVVSLIDAYAKAGFLHGARLVFATTATRSVIVWTSIISAHAAHGDATSAITLFTEMIASGMQPDHVTFTAVLSACAHAGAVNEAQRIFDAMSSAYRIHPTAENYACMVGVMSRAGMLKEAVKFISKMPMEPNKKAWGALLNGASVAGDVEIARLAFDRLVGIEPESDGNYIIMANVYSKAGRWKEATKVREDMKRTGLAKIPGCSWIETSIGLQVFVARDTSSTCSEAVYDTLGSLVQLMREEGYISEDELDEKSACC